MILADRIRQFVVVTYINPARLAGHKTVKVVAGPVHSGMGLVDRMPAICGALDAYKFLSFARVRLISRSGPKQGSTATWIFELINP